MEQQEEYFSFSRLRYFSSCPRKFYFRYILKLPEPTNVGIISGKVIHKNVEAEYKQKIEKDYYSQTSEIVDKAIFDYETEIETTTEEITDLQDKDKEKDLLAKGIKEFHSKVVINKIPIEVEKEVSFRFKDGLLIKGYIDLLEKEDKVKIVEFKTTSKKPNLVYPVAQVTLYSIAKKLPDIKIEYLIKKKEPEIQVFNFQISDIYKEELLAELKQIYNTYKSLLSKSINFWWRNQGWWCEGCWFKEKCYKEG